MSRLTRLLTAVALVGALTVPATAPAGTLGTGDETAIRMLIEDQIEAFRRDDGDAAYAMASPTIRGIFPTVAQFMAMVRQGYQPVYRPRSVVFGALAETAQGPIQQVFLTGPDGQSYVAVYSLERQADGAWRIGGVVIVRDRSPAI